MGIFSGLFKKAENLIAVDIGSTSTKFLELDLSSSKPKLVNLIVNPTSGEIFSNNQIKNSDTVAERISAIIETNGITGRKGALAIPGPSVFTKRLKVSKVPVRELGTTIQFEAGNLIPHKMDAVKLDYHIISESGKNQLDVLVVAAKNEVIESFTQTLATAGLDTAVVDVDYFALQNCFELGYPEFLDKRVAVINIGARYSSVNICHNGQSLFTGDVSIGGKAFTDAIMQELSCDFERAEKLKKKPDEDPSNKQAINDLIERKAESTANEFNRQLSLYWSSLGLDGNIDCIFLTGGASKTNGLLEELRERTGIKCEYLNPLRGIDISGAVDSQFIEENSSLLAIATGLAIRQSGDKEIINY